jgi:hypothetical protein
VADTLYFARRLTEAGHRLGPIVVNQVHPVPGVLPVGRRKASGSLAQGLELLAFLAERDQKGVAALQALLGPDEPLVALPLLPDPPTSLPGVAALGTALGERLAARNGTCRAAV